MEMIEDLWMACILRCTFPLSCLQERKRHAAGCDSESVGFPKEKGTVACYSKPRMYFHSAASTGITDRRLPLRSSVMPASFG